MYRQLFAEPGARSLAIGSLIARMPLAMAPLAMVLAVSAHRSVAFGGLSVAAYTLGAAGLGPLRGRLVDRIGSRPVLVVGGLGQGLSLLGFALCEPATWSLALAAAAGATMPPISPITRATWGRLFADRPELLHAAQSTESAMIDLSYVVAPALAAVLVAVANPDVGVLTAAALAALGSLALASSRHLGRPERLPPSGFRVRTIAPLLAVGLLTIATISAVEIAAVQVARHAHRPSAAGWLVALLSVGSIAGGLAYGSKRPPGRDRTHVAATLAGWAVVTLACATTGDLVAVGLLLVVGGVVLAPTVTAQYAIVAGQVPGAAQVEAYAWVVTAYQAGSAVGASIAGAVSVPFVVSAGLAVVAVAATAAIRVPAAG